MMRVFFSFVAQEGLVSVEGKLIPDSEFRVDGVGRYSGDPR